MATTAAPPGPAVAGRRGPVTEACSAVVTLSGAEQRLLTALPDPGHVVTEQLWCDLEGGHEGLHWGLGQVSGPDWWWLRWYDDTHQQPMKDPGEDPGDGTDRRELVHRDACRRFVTGDEPGQPDQPCALPVGHAGAHSYTRPT